MRLNPFRRKPTETRFLSQGGQPTSFLPATVGSFNFGGRADAGIPVDEMTAITASAVYACVAVIANSIGTLPLHVVKRNQQEQQVNHPIYNLLHDTPNEFMTAITFRETMLVNLLLWGACYAYIERDPTGVPIGLYPLRSQVTRPVRMNGELMYLTMVGTDTMYLRQDQIFNVLNLTYDGITPISPIRQARQSIGLSLALERFAASFFGNGSNVGGILSLPPMTDAAIQNFVDSWKHQYAGPDNALKVGILPPDYKFTPTTTDPESAQALQARVNQVREVARVYRVPLHKLADLERSTFSNIEAQERQFYTDCLAPWCSKWEAECNRKLLLEVEKPLLECAFDLEGLMRADIQARNASYTAGRNGGWLTVNDIRAKEGLPAVAGGDVLLQPLNMVPVGNPTALQGPSIKAPPPPPDEAEGAGATRALVEDAAKRLLTKESKALARAVKKHAGNPTELRKWAETWYAAHEPLVVRVLTPTLKAGGITTTPEAYAKAHCQESIRAITAAAANHEDLLDEWETIRPAEIADLLTKKAV